MRNVALPVRYNQLLIILVSLSLLWMFNQMMLPVFHSIRQQGGRKGHRTVFETNGSSSFHNDPLVPVSRKTLCCCAKCVSVATKSVGRRRTRLLRLSLILMATDASLLLLLTFARNPGLATRVSLNSRRRG